MARFIERSLTHGAGIRRGGADGSRPAAIVAADGHRLPFDGGPGHDATQPTSGAAHRARGGDRRGRRRAAPARLRTVVPQLRRSLRARVGARRRARAEPGLRGPLRPHPAPARDRRLAPRRALRPERRRDHAVARPPLLRRARLAHLPPRRRAVLALGRRRRGARRPDPAGARARRARRLPGHRLRGADRVGRAARGPPPAAWNRRPRGARGRGSHAPRGLGAGGALRGVGVAGRLGARACDLCRPRGGRAAAVGARRPARHGRRPALPPRDGRAGGDRRPPARPRHGPVLDREVPRLRVARAARPGRSDRPRLRDPPASPRRRAPAPGRRCHARGVRGEPVLRAAADRALRADPGRPSDALLRARRLRMADGPAGPGAPGLGGGGLLAAALSIAYGPAHAKLLSGLGNRVTSQGTYYRDLRAVGQAPAVRAALGECGPLATADHRPVPHLRWWLGSAPGTVMPAADPAAGGARLLLLPRRTPEMRRFYRKNFPTATRPPGARPLYRNDSWRVLALRGCRLRAGA